MPINFSFPAFSAIILSMGHTSSAKHTEHIFRGISTNSRTVKKGELFIALSGEKFDGHKFVAQALKKGAAGALISKTINIKTDKPLIRVRDTLKAFQELARIYKKRFDIPFVGITGSSGKTTTKDMLASILSLAGKTLKTEENYNNEVGVPQTLLKLTKRHKFAVIEMAMQGLGEIKELAEIVTPHIAVITNIGSSHLKYLKTQVNVAKAKSEILLFQKENDIAILPADSEYFKFLDGRAKGKVLSFGIENNPDIYASNINYQCDSSTFNIRGERLNVSVNLPQPGKHNIYDALAAAAAAISLKIKPAHIKRGLETFKLSSKRSNIIKTRGITVIDDTYNANPDSMAAALNVLENYPGRRIAVLGDMFELGKIAASSHKKTGELSRALGIDILITVGKLMKLAKGDHHFSSNAQAMKKLKSIIKSGDAILVKGSRGMRMEEIVKGLIK
jgi:UDP-N-acetylmuramoyl-tripeptide--D-alanyl-D-alanine ligase